MRARRTVAFGSAYPGDVEARALGDAMSAAADRGERVPCEGTDPASVRPTTCAACPLDVLTACGDYGRAAGAVGTFGGVRLGAPRKGRRA